jgi:hypothetical protein
VETREGSSVAVEIDAFLVVCAAKLRYMLEGFAFVAFHVMLGFEMESLAVVGSYRNVIG